jgi:glycosyltransferase involved in cell wall biosynthesis
MKLGVLVPCRNEAAVIVRKLRNLARCEWPRDGRPHRVCVVDDGSQDATAELARAAAAELDPALAVADVVANAARPGKGGAIEAGLAALGEAVDVVVLTDADVVLEPGALVALARAFELEPRLAMASGAQRFVADLAGDGTPRAAGGGAARPSPSFFDAAANAVRALESRFGLLFSVQGQLMAWRRELALSPTPRMTADDLDLMLQARATGRPVRRVAAARFLEVRPPRGPERQRQAVRRARAYHQFLRHPRIDELSGRGRWLEDRQARAYRRAGRFGAGWSVLPLATIFAGGMLLGPGGAIAATAACAALLLPAWLVVLRIRSRLQLAAALEARSPMGERWETARR